MTILFTTEQYYPLQTGLASADYGLSLALAKAGHLVYVITTGMYGETKITREGKLSSISSGNLSKEIVEIASNLFVLEFKISCKNWGEWEGETEEYQNFVQNFKCDLLINSAILTWNTDFIYDYLPSCLAKKKILRSHGEYSLMHGWALGDKEKLKDSMRRLVFSPKRYKQKYYIAWLRYKLKKSLKHYDCVYFLHKNSHAYNYLKPYCSYIDILPNGVFEKDICPPKTIASALTEQQNNRTTEQLADLLLKPYVLNVSNYYKEKGQDFVLRAYYLSQAKIPLIFIGSLNRDNFLEELKELKKQLDLEYGFREVYFFHRIKRSQVLAILQQATLFLHGSQALYECFPMVILESMQFGIPFICTDVGNVKDLCIELVVNTPEQMAEKINALLGNPKFYNKITQELHNIIQEYTYEKIAKKLEALVS
ncbi:glycosyltransferase family 4 protein [Helicobacter suis]|uniref:glycosyltransferase family 4 protein n=1 Tax=Helicobacter suis TaxID=104628 RepID=UPI0013D12899|nr:glycosyltransferase family 4 protein [Helicobacter suis]